LIKFCVAEKQKVTKFKKFKKIKYEDRLSLLGKKKNKKEQKKPF